MRVDDSLQGPDARPGASPADATHSPTTSASGTVTLGITEADYLRIHPKLAAKVRQFGIPSDQVEELVQQSFLEAHKGLCARRFRGESAIDTWVVSIAKNLCLKHHRSQRAAKRSAAEVSLDGTGADAGARQPQIESASPLPDREVQDRERLVLALRILQALPAALREPLVLQVRGHSYEQIARLLDIPSNLVSSRIHQARAELRRELPDSQTSAST